MPKIAMIAYDIVALLGSIENLEDDILINDLINDEGYIGLRGLFRLKNNGIVERTFQLKKIKNKRFTILRESDLDIETKPSVSNLYSKITDSVNKES